MNQLFATRLVPVVILDDVSRAEGLGQALVAGGLPVAEVTFRTTNAAACIEAMAANKDLLVGAGTVVTVEQVKQAHSLGASFVVSPGLDADVVRAARELGLTVLPGVVTPSEIIAAIKLGLDVVKFFPAGNYGGAKTLKAFASPFGQVKFLPTGGVNLDNLGDYLSLPNVVAAGGSWMVPADAVAAGDFDTVTRLCSEAVAAAAQYTN